MRDIFVFLSFILWFYFAIKIHYLKERQRVVFKIYEKNYLKLIGYKAVWTTTLENSKLNSIKFKNYLLNSSILMKIILGKLSF